MPVKIPPINPTSEIDAKNPETNPIKETTGVTTGYNIRQMTNVVAATIIERNTVLTIENVLLIVCSISFTIYSC